MTDSGEFHPIANHWPLLEGDELFQLADDIKVRGVINPIWRTSDGLIIDGRNRWNAAKLAKVECPSQTYQGEEGAALVAFVLSLNERRRHLPVDQRAAIAADLVTGSHGGDRSKTSPDVLTYEQAAKAQGVSRPTVDRAVALRKAAPDLHEKVKSGKMKAGEARKTAADRKGFMVEIRRPLSDDVKPYRAPGKAEVKALAEAKRIELWKKVMKFANDVSIISHFDVEPEQIEQLEPKKAEMFWRHLRSSLHNAMARLATFAGPVDAAAPTETPPAPEVEDAQPELAAVPTPEPAPEVENAQPEPAAVPTPELPLDTEAAEPEPGNGHAPKRRGRKPGPPKVVIPEIEALIDRGFTLGEISAGMGGSCGTAAAVRGGHVDIWDEMRARLQAYAMSVGVAS